MNQPWYLVGFGFLGSLLGGFLTLVGITQDGGSAVTLAGWAIGGLSGLALFVGLIALGVEIGVRGADR